MVNVHDALQDLLNLAQRSSVPNEEIIIEGQEPMLPSRFFLGTAAATSMVAVGVAASDLWYLRTGRRQTVSLDLRSASVALRSNRYMQINGQYPKDLWGPISGFYQTLDERWIQLHCNFPHHIQGVLDVLKCENDREAVSKSISGWKGQELEDALADTQMCAGLVRSREEWEAHPQAQAVAQLPLFEIIKIGEGDPEPLGEGDQPLSGIRVLDLTRVIAGPMGGRTLAEHGADVMRIGAAHLPHVESLVLDTGYGKLSAHLDLRQASEKEKLKNLIRQSDVFSQSYRAGALSSRDFSPEALAKLRPGIVYVTLSAYSHKGPWRQRRGFDTLVQSVSGMVDEVSTPENIRHIPAQILDYFSGYLMAFGSMIALARRTQEGGSYLVRVSLAQTAHWVHQLGRMNDDLVQNNKRPNLELEDVQDLLMNTKSSFGLIRHVAPVLKLSETSPHWRRPVVPLGYHDPIWPKS